MRQGNSNKRMRGRGGSGSGGGNGGGHNNPGRKGPNPLSRSYESTGPDVKIRGTALHIAEKYVSLARDAQSSGDPVLAESYLQHAEHYYRIVAAAQAALPQPMQVMRSDIQVDDEDDDGDESYAETRFDTRGRGGDVRPEVNGNVESNRNEGPREAREPREPREMRETREPREMREPREAREPREPRAEARPPLRRAIDLEGGDGYMPVDAPQPFVDDSALERVVGERDDRRPGRSRFRTGGRNDYRGDAREPRTDAPRAEGPRPEAARPEAARPEGARAEGARPPRERHPRGERFERGPREPRVAADAEPIENNLDALPAFLTAAPPRVAVAAVAAAAAEAQAEAEAPVTAEAEAPVRRTRGGRGRGRRPEFEAGETPAPAAAEE